MAPQVLTTEGKTSYASFWPSIASASTQLSRRRHPHPGRMRSGNPAVPGLAPPGYIGGSTLGRSATPKGGF